MFIGGTKEGELHRSADLYCRISKEQGPLLALYFIYDSQYDRKDIKRILEIIETQRLDKNND